jgi:hypothetical protein
MEDATPPARARAAAEGTVGLCATCDHGRTIVSARGSVFRLCGLAARDPRFPKYPRLPVVRCAGFAPRGGRGGAPERPTGAPR